MNPRLFLTAFILATAVSAPAAIVTQWSFNGATATTVPLSSAAPPTPLPSAGTGTASLLAGVTSPSFNSGSGSSDTVSPTGNNFAWQTTTYPAGTVGDQTAGVRFDASTVGYDTITVSFDLRHSNTSSKYVSLQYTVDGINFVQGANFTATLGDTFFNNRSLDLSAIPAANNNPNFGIRIVTAFETTATGSGTAAYVASSNGTAATYAGGTLRFDMVTINGVPEPSSALLGLLGGAALLRRRRS